MMFTFFISFCKFSTQEPSTGILTRLSSSSKLRFYACRHPDCNVVFTSILFIRLDLYSTAEMNKQHKFGWVSGVMLVVAWLSTMYIIYGRVACTRRPQLLKPVIFGCAYVMCNRAQILICWKHCKSK